MVHSQQASSPTCHTYHTVLDAQFFGFAADDDVAENDADDDCAKMAVAVADDYNDCDLSKVSIYH